jgi:hypothetical protein
VASNYEAYLNKNESSEDSSEDNDGLHFSQLISADTDDAITSKWNPKGFLKFLNYQSVTPERSLLEEIHNQTWLSVASKHLGRINKYLTEGKFQVVRDNIIAHMITRETVTRDTTLDGELTIGHMEASSMLLLEPVTRSSDCINFYVYVPGLYLKHYKKNTLFQKFHLLNFPYTDWNEVLAEEQDLAYVLFLIWNLQRKRKEEGNHVQTFDLGSLYKHLPVGINVEFPDNYSMVRLQGEGSRVANVNKLMSNCQAVLGYVGFINVSKSNFVDWWIDLLLAAKEASRFFIFGQTKLSFTDGKPDPPDIEYNKLKDAKKLNHVCLYLLPDQVAPAKATIKKCVVVDKHNAEEFYGKYLVDRRKEAVQFSKLGLYFFQFVMFVH